MDNTTSILNLFESLWQHVTKRRRWQFVFLLMLMLMTSFSEVLSITSLLPFLTALSSPEKIFRLQEMQFFIEVLQLHQPKELLLPLIIVFTLATVFATGMRLLLLWVNTKMSFAVGAEIGVAIYRKVLYQSYDVYCTKNSSELIDGVINKASSVINILNMFLTLISSVLMLVCILFAFLAVNAIMAITFFCGFSFIYLILMFFTREKIAHNSRVIARESMLAIKALQEGFGGIRDVLIDGTQEIYCQQYQFSDVPFRRAQASNVFIAGAPRYALEALGMLLIAGSILFLSEQPDGLNKAIPILGVLVLGAQRLLPVLQQSYGAWSGIKGNQASLRDAIKLISQPLPVVHSPASLQPMPFGNNIILNQVSFKYTEETPYVLKRINLLINKGSRVGVIGATGSGKSTLVDVIMGLLTPTIGSIEIDGQSITADNCTSWKLQIAHVPQTIFLADKSIEENIAFGVPKNQIDPLRVRQAASQAQIAGSIEEWPEQYHTVVGDRGIRLSGGERQRIGIARALYKRAKVIIFDEATSALDADTEEAVMNSIKSLSPELTVIIIAHRLSTLKSCEKIIELHDGTIKRIMKYDEMIDRINEKI